MMTNGQRAKIFTPYAALSGFGSFILNAERRTEERVLLGEDAQEELNRRLKQIETDFGRTPEKRQRGIVPIDLDILQYGDQRHHERDWQRPYVADLLGQLQ